MSPEIHTAHDGESFACHNHSQITIHEVSFSVVLLQMCVHCFLQGYGQAAHSGQREVEEGYSSKDQGDQGGWSQSIKDISPDQADSSYLIYFV